MDKCPSLTACEQWQEELTLRPGGVSSNLRCPTAGRWPPPRLHIRILLPVLHPRPIK